MKKYEKVGEDPKVYILDHFDLYLNNPKWSHTKLLLLENLISVYKKTVVIVSTIDPLKFLSRIAKPPAIKDEEKPTAQEQDLYDRWAMILSSFTKNYHNINIDSTFFVNFVNTKCMERIDNLPDGQDERKLKSLYETIIKECQHTSFLQRIGVETVESVAGSETSCSPDLLINEILQKTETYYQSIWSVCSTEEKITLEVISKRKSVRNYTDEPFSRDELMKLLKAGMSAPSANDKRPWAINSFECSLHRISQRICKAKR